MRQKQELESIGNRILSELRTELYLSLRVMGPALDALDYCLDLTTQTLGTDGSFIRYNPRYLIDLFLEWPKRLSRCYMHMLLHGLFRHLFLRERYEDKELFDLCADIAAESILDTIDIPALKEIPSDFRESRLRRLQDEIHVLTAEKLYRHFTENPPDYEERMRLVREFYRDDHHFWEDLDRDPDSQNPPPSSRRQREQDWNDRSKNTRDLIAAIGSEASDERGSLAWMLSFENDAKTDYRDFLRRFVTVREEVRIDPDGFDYGYYHYGMEMFGNMPLIEENEYRETVGIDQLVIAIDTSGSTRPYLVQHFLRETAAILSSQETFLHRVEIHLIECDNQIQSDRVLTDVRELEQYAGQFQASGGMGTDFRPVFQYVRQLQLQGKLDRLRGLMYFTDGFGTYPTEPTSFDTAFVFRTDAAYNDKDVPDWAIRLYVSDEDSAQEGVHRGSDPQAPPTADFSE